MATQVHQVFFVEDPIDEDIHYVMRKVPWDLFDLVEGNNDNPQKKYWGDVDDENNNLDENKMLT